MKKARARSGIDIPEAFNAFTKLALAPLGVEVAPLQDMPAGREWFDLVDEHGLFLRVHWIGFVTALVRAQALAAAQTQEARRALQREFEEWSTVRMQRAAFVTDVRRVMCGHMTVDGFANMYMVPFDGALAIFHDAHENAGHAAIAASISVEFDLFGDGKRTIEQAKDSHKKAHSWLKSICP